MLCALKGVLKIMAVKGSVTDAVRQGHSSQGKRASWCIHRTCLGLWGQQTEPSPRPDTNPSQEGRPESRVRYMGPLWEGREDRVGDMWGGVPASGPRHRLPVNHGTSC